MLNIERRGGGGGGRIFVIGCTLFVAAVGAAFVARRAQKSSGSRGRGREVNDGVDNREEKRRGLQDLLPSLGW